MAWTETQTTLTCDRSGVDHLLTVTAPFRYERLESAPLVLCLDGAWVGGTVRDATRLMSMSGEAPEAVVASLSLTDSSMSDLLRSRARWFCPTEWVPPEIAGVKVTDASQTGQAHTYLAFIRDQVLPTLHADFRVGERWLVGHSFSALFGLRTLLTEPELFDKYLLASPSIWWDNRVIRDIEAEYATNHDDLAASVFMTAGAEEALLGEAFNMAGNVVEMASRLASHGYPSLTLSHEVLPSESHSSTVGQAISRGLRALV